MKNNLIVGAISGNYTVEEVAPWVKSINSWRSKKNSVCEVVLLLYNFESENGKQLSEFLSKEKVGVFTPTSDMYNNPVNLYETHTGRITKDNAHILVHNIRFFDLWKLLTNKSYEKVLITDVKDLVVIKNPFTRELKKQIVVSSEMIVYKDHHWNKQHILHTLGVASYYMLEEEIYNVGCIESLRDLSLEIYLIAKNVDKVADQTAFNFLIQTSYKDKVHFSRLDEKWGVHLHVVGEGYIPFDYNTLEDYTIIHQYDRIDGIKQKILDNYSV
jgi:hypothetical protein